MTTTVRNANAPGTVFTVLARDFAGNLTTKKATIPIAGGKPISSEGSPITANDKKQVVNEATGRKITTRVVGSVALTVNTN